MPDYEKGTPAWDIGIVLTRHRSILPRCNRVQVLVDSAGQGIAADLRLREALNTRCTCDTGDSDAESTSLQRRPNATNSAITQR